MIESMQTDPASAGENTCHFLLAFMFTKAGGRIPESGLSGLHLAAGAGIRSIIICIMVSIISMRFSIIC